jgi:hypothetical protein
LAAVEDQHHLLPAFSAESCADVRRIVIYFTWTVTMSLLDPKWKYTHSTATDIRKTFAKARKQIAKKDESYVKGPKLQLMRGPSEEANSGGMPQGAKPFRPYARTTAMDATAERRHDVHRAFRFDLIDVSRQKESAV